MFNNRTKIVATLGPASMNPDMIRELAKAGADVFRLNFSHGTHEKYIEVIQWIRQTEEDLGEPLAILADLCGPKLRIGEVDKGEYAVKKGDEIVLTSDPTDGSNGVFHLNVEKFSESAKAGERILIDDGQIEFEITQISGARVICNAINDGTIRPHKGVNLPNTRLPIPALTHKDKQDMQFAIEQKVDLFAMSFVRSALDVRMARNTAFNLGGEDIPILAKIETTDAVTSIESIVEAADGAMVARGDMGIEIPVEQVPTAQKRIIRICNFAAKPVITATQMLDSMIRNPRPTRAEVTDVYNAILDGTDAVMLSGETAVGDYPLDAVRMMERLAREAEKLYRRGDRMEMLLNAENGPSTTQSICHAVSQIAEELNLDCIIVPTKSGHSARHISQFRPRIPILAYSMHNSVVNQLCLAWGVHSGLMEEVHIDADNDNSAEALVEALLRRAKGQGFVKPGDRVVALGGLPLNQPQITNFLRVIDVK